VISAHGVTMRLPIPKCYRELVFAPFGRRNFFTALKSVDLEIEKGDRIAVLGPNGAGKTTLLKLVGGLLLPTEGEIVVNGSLDALRLTILKGYSLEMIAGQTLTLGLIAAILLPVSL
jgi:ABC-type multidrug transport system ATPase subunit